MGYLTCIAGLDIGLQSAPDCFSLPLARMRASSALLCTWHILSKKNRNLAWFMCLTKCLNPDIQLKSCSHACRTPCKAQQHVTNDLLQSEDVHQMNMRNRVQVQNRSYSHLCVDVSDFRNLIRVHVLLAPSVCMILEVHTVYEDLCGGEAMAGIRLECSGGISDEPAVNNNIDNTTIVSVRWATACIERTPSLCSAAERHAYPGTYNTTRQRMLLQWPD